MEIEFCQNAADWLYAAMGGDPKIMHHDGNAPQTQEDAAIFEIAKNAENGDKFLALWQGKWQDLGYPSQSEADFALYDILAYYTKNAAQIRRMFMTSELGNRPKALRDEYHNYMLRRAFDRDIPPVDFDGMEIAAKIALDKHKAKEQEKDAQHAGNVSHTPGSTALNACSNASEAQAPVSNSDNSVQDRVTGAPSPFKRNPRPYTLPPGLVGEIARYIYQSAPRQVEEIALTAAIGLMAGICGRAYNVSATGLNLYLLVLAQTAHGKEAVASGIDAILSAVEKEIPVAPEIRGPGAIASGQAIIKSLAKAKQPCFVSVIGEFGWKFKNMAAENANAADVTLKMVMLDLYMKSGHTQKFPASIYAQDKNDVPSIASPSWSLVCESVPSVFYSVVKERVIQDGLLPRFIIIDSQKPRGYLNPNTGNSPPDELQVNIVSLFTHALELQNKKQVINVTISPNAQTRAKQLDEWTTDQINKTNADLLQHLWGRVHLNVLRLAALIAIGVNHIQPTITEEIFEWSADLVIHSTYGLLDRFEAGEIGEDEGSEHAQMKTVEKFIKEYLLKDFAEIGKSYKISKEIFDAKLIPYSYLQPQLVRHAVFKSVSNAYSTRGTQGLKNILDTMVNIGTLVKIPLKDAREKYKTGVQLYGVANFAALGIGN